MSMLIYKFNFNYKLYFNVNVQLQCLIAFPLPLAQALLNKNSKGQTAQGVGLLPGPVLCSDVSLADDRYVPGVVARYVSPNS